MLKNTHIELSTSLVLIFIFLTFTTFDIFWWWIFPIYVFLLLPILAVLPDSDHPESYLNKKFPLLKNVHILWPHRTWTHDLFTLLIISIWLYLWFWKLFWYFDYTLQLEWKTWILYYLEYLYFFIKSPNFIAIYIALFWHTFWDFLTKWTIKFFRWAECITKIFWKIKILKFTIWLPFYLLYMLQEIINKVKWNIFPLTWSWFERNIYSTIFNVLNYILLFILFFLIWIHEKILYTFSLIAWDWKTLTLTQLWIFAIFFWISMWYFFSLSLEKLKQYLKTWTWMIKFIWFEILLMFILYIIYTKLNWEYWYYILWESIVWTVVLYRRYIKLDFDYFNIVLNECLLLLIYLYLSLFIVWSTLFVPKFDKDKINNKIELNWVINTLKNETQEKINQQKNTTKQETNIELKKEDKKENKKEERKQIKNEDKKYSTLKKEQVKDSIFWDF